ncbi:MAG TPA: DMT family transporter, partial [Kofleriaceae bacterium]|nr:DMT family transporter [Kofleriaceae bacterium]
LLSTAAPLIRAAAPVPPLAIAALRVCLAALALGIIGRRELATLGTLGRRERWLVVAAGTLLGVHFGVWITSLSFTSTAASVALVATNPMFAALLGWMVGDAVSRREWAGIAVAAGGCALLAGGDWQAGGDALVGDGLAVLGAATAAGYLVVGRRLRAALPIFPYLAAVNGVAGLGLLIAALVAGVMTFELGGDITPWSYAAIAASALFASVGGHTLLNIAVRRAPAHLVALAILGEPVGASLISWAAFGEVPPWTAAVGGVVILGGIGVGFTGKAKE